MKRAFLALIILAISSVASAATLEATLDWAGTDYPPDDRDQTRFDPRAGRLQDIFLDHVASLVRDPSRLRHLLNPRFEGVLGPAEARLARRLAKVFVLETKKG